MSAEPAKLAAALPPAGAWTRTPIAVSAPADFLARGAGAANVTVRVGPAAGAALAFSFAVVGAIAVSPPALALVLVGLIPVMLLSRALRRPDPV